MTQGDMFYKLFLGDVCLNNACEIQCKYKYNCSSADIRIGDLWGNAYADDEKGVSALISFTEKGRHIIESLKDVTLVNHPFEIVAEGQMKSNAKHKECSSLIMSMLRHKTPIDGLPFRSILFAQRVIGKLKRLTGL